MPFDRITHLLPTHLGHPRQQVEVLTRKDIEKEYVLVKAKLSLLQKEDSFATRLSSKTEMDRQTLPAYIRCLPVCVCLCNCLYVDFLCVCLSVYVSVSVILTGNLR